jgi:hypothetical protein
MAQSMQATRVYLEPNYTGVISCLCCGVKRSIDMGEHQGKLLGKTFHLQCSTCDGVFLAVFDRRRHHRLHVHLPGRLVQPHTQETLGNIVVTSLSITGLRFITRSKTAFKAGDRYEVVFMLDDVEQSMITEEVVIARVHGNVVGASFANQSNYQSEIGFYLMYATPTPEDIDQSRP